MTLPAVPTGELFDLVTAGSGRDATAFLLDQFDAGRSPAALVTELLAAVQIEIGERWQLDLLTTADEHAASAIVDNALAALAGIEGPAPGLDRGSLAVVCAEGEWHTLPARMAAQLWRWDGWDVVFLGGSLPSADLGSWLAASRPDALAVSCTVPMFLPGVLRVAQAAAAAGVPCVTGGRGLGVNPRRAEALGVRWAPSPAALPAALDAPAPTVDRADLDHRSDTANHLSAIVDELTAAALASLTTILPALRDSTAVQIAATKADCWYFLQFLAAAVLCDDTDLFTDFATWLQTVLTHRGLPPTVLPTGLTALADVLPPSQTQARTLCDLAARHLTAT